MCYFDLKYYKKYTAFKLFTVTYQIKPFDMVCPGLYHYYVARLLYYLHRDVTTITTRHTGSGHRENWTQVNSPYRKVDLLNLDPTQSCPTPKITK